MINDKPQRLLLVALNYAPELTGIGKYVGELAEFLASKAVSVRVVTAPPHYPAWRVQPGYARRSYVKERLAGVDVYRCPVWVPRRPRARTRVLHQLSFALSSLPVMLWQALVWRPHVVFVVEPPLGCAPGARLAAKLCGARSWLHVQDFEVDAAFDLGLLSMSWLKKRLLAVERRLMCGFDCVSSISERMLAKLGGKGVEQGQILYFPNWVDTGLIRPLEEGSTLRAELGISREMRVLLYSGNMGEKQGLESIVDMARSFASTDDVLFLLCGEGAARARIQRMAVGLSNLRFLPLQPLSKLNELLNLADVHLLPQRPEAADLVMPSKLSAIMASGRPVVATAYGGSDVARVAAEGGIVVAPGDAQAFELAIRTLLDNQALRRRLGASARAYATANWDRELVLRRMLGMFGGRSLTDEQVGDTAAAGPDIAQKEAVNQAAA